MDSWKCIYLAHVNTWAANHIQEGLFLGKPGGVESVATASWIAE